MPPDRQLSSGDRDLSALATEIRAEMAAAERDYRSTVQHGRRVNDLLAEAQAALPNGAWPAWAEANVGVAARMPPDRDTGAEVAWLTFDEDEEADAERVMLLEGQASRSDDPTEAAQLLAEADQLRERWDRPRQRFSSLAEIIDELAAVGNDVRSVDTADPDALYDIAVRGAKASIALEAFAQDLAEQQHQDDEQEN